jgi:glycerol-3-phosphate dehydrogenase (NAD+)
LFADEVRMWVFEETLPTGEKLSESINQAHVRAELVPFLVCFTLEQVVPCTVVIIFVPIVFQENCKYLPGIKLGTNVIADPDLESAGNHTVTHFCLSRKLLDTSNLCNSS